MNRTPTLRHRITRNVAVAALGSLLALGAGPLRADDPYPPLDAEAQRVVDEARAQMRAIDRQLHLATADAGGSVTDTPAEERRWEQEQDCAD